MKDFEVFDFPFMFATPKPKPTPWSTARWGRSCTPAWQEKNIVGLAYWELGFRNITNSKRAINKVEDLEGLKLRVIPNAINVDWVKARGRQPDADGLPRGLPGPGVEGHRRAGEPAQRHPGQQVRRGAEVPGAVSNHQYNPQSVIISKKVWDTLSSAEQKILQDAAIESAAFQRKTSRDAAAGQLDALKKAGMTVTELSARRTEPSLREKMQPGGGQARRGHRRHRGRDCRPNWPRLRK